MSKHTPGPWKSDWVRPFRCDVYAPDGELRIATVHGKNVDADARLIAAAPEMHAILHEILDQLCDEEEISPGLENKISRLLARIGA